MSNDKTIENFQIMATMIKVSYRNRKIHKMGVDEVTVVTDDDLKKMKKDVDIQIISTMELTEWQYKTIAGVFVRITEEAAWIMKTKKEKPTKKDKFYGFGSESYEKAEDFIVSYNSKRFFKN